MSGFRSLGLVLDNIVLDIALRMRLRADGLTDAEVEIAMAGISAAAIKSVALTAPEILKVQEAA